jgi:tetratricopeptide (TPR) repeat protein
MMVRACRSLATFAAAALLAAPAAAQLFSGVSIPPSDFDIDGHSRGGAQHALVSQGIGLVRVTIDYSSPHVHSPTGVDRRGKIWGKGNLVEYGMASLPFGSCGSQCPWRGGANENTVFTTSHDVMIQGQRLAAGSYGLFFIPEANEWTIIFSRNHTSWGSFYYDAKEDALRVLAKPQASEYHEDLTYEFRDQKSDSVTAVLRWEDLQLPFAIKVENINELYVEKMGEELRSAGGVNWRGWATAAQFCLTNKIHLDDALLWARRGADPNFGGEQNATTLFTLALALDANGKATEGKAMLGKAIHSPNAGPVDIHLIGRRLLAMHRPADAMEVFTANAELHPDVWPVHFGLARGHAALGQKDQAIAEAKLALPQAPDPANQKAIQDFIANLEAEKPAN